MYIRMMFRALHLGFKKIILPVRILFEYIAPTARNRRLIQINYLVKK